MPENKAELNITNVAISEYRSGIPLQGWESVTSALNTYSKGGSRSSRATRNDLEKNVAEMGGGLGLGLLFLSQGPRSAFVEDMLQEAKAGVDSRGRWERHYDYDGQGVFHKTTVEVQKLAEVNNGYLLGLNAAYVGKAVEDGLAETLGVEQGLQWKSVKVELAPDGKQFVIDYDAVAEKLQPVLAELERPRGRAKLIGSDIVRHILDTHSYAHYHEALPLGVKDGVEVTFQQGEVGDRYDMETDRDKKHSLWVVEGFGTLRGPLDHDWEDKSKLLPPSFGVSIHRFSKERYDRLPAVDPKMKANMNDLADRVATAFKA